MTRVVIVKDAGIGSPPGIVQVIDRNTPISCVNTSSCHARLDRYTLLSSMCVCVFFFCLFVFLFVFVVVFQLD